LTGPATLAASAAMMPRAMRSILGGNDMIACLVEMLRA